MGSILTMLNGNLSNRHGSLVMIDFDSVLLEYKPTFLEKILGGKIKLKLRGVGLLKRLFRKTDFRIYVVSTVVKNEDEIKELLRKFSVPFYEVLCYNVLELSNIYRMAEFDMLVTDNEVFKGEMNVGYSLSSSELLALV